MATERAGPSFLSDRYDQRKDVSLIRNKTAILFLMSRVTTSSSHFESGLSHLNGQTKIASSDNLAQTAFKIQTIRFYEANHER